MEFFGPFLLIVTIYGAVSAAIVATVRTTLKKRCPRVEACIWSIEVVKRLIPCVVAFGLACCGTVGMFGFFGLDVPVSEVWGVRVGVGVIAGIFSGWAWHLMRDLFRSRRRQDDFPDAP